MSVNKKYFQLQDLILIKTSIEKVVLHINERKERSIFSWIDKELSGLWNLKDEELKNDIEEVKKYVKNEDYIKTKEKLQLIEKKIEEKINQLYKEMLNY
ncbi:hypothetical protein EWF20_13365 [Sulfolobus sp. S-194]|uniref:hypothetical protein n=1 Tax=Sulfolobus sp. S-194 TaxID=2512240 RepID=UPI001436E1F5|nr:hypothetical protein [Sulfolobus sp. S-194]QIW25020.1 hypothetical protein EWF20_13365 [Sulfolobus sp. S-194]